MGVIIKFIIIFLVVSYLIRKVGGFFMKLFFGQTTNNQQSSGGYYQQNTKSNAGNGSRYGSLRIFKKPNKGNAAEKNFTGGEYVDYEEVD